MSRIIRIIYTDPTGSAELVLSICYVGLPGLALALGKTEIPYRASNLLETLPFHNDHIQGVILFSLGLLQLWGAGTEWFRARALVSTFVAAFMAVIVLAYGFTGEFYRWTVPMMIGTVLAEMFVSWRCWHERPFTQTELHRLRVKHEHSPSHT